MKNLRVTRRGFLRQAAATGTVLAGIGDKQLSAAEGGSTKAKKPDQFVFPRWRGFNLLYFFTKRGYSKPVENDFKFAADWGFDFLRIPMDYHIWTEDTDVYKIKEEPFERIDQVVEWGQKYKQHVCLNFHRGPGYCINNGDTEPFNLWKDKEAQDAFCHHWGIFTKRYKGIDPKKLSFDLLNEPVAAVNVYDTIVRRTVKTIRAADPNRLVIIDGLQVGRTPVPELADLKIGQSCRGYNPGGISHYRAGWVDRSSSFPEPIWPDPQHKTHGWDRKKLEEMYGDWAKLARQGVGVHCGECGCYNKTPQGVFLAWFEDVLDVLTGHNIGYALWNLRGSFGILDSGRRDVVYEDFHGHKLDRKLLELLKKY